MVAGTERYFETAAQAAFCGLRGVGVKTERQEAGRAGPIRILIDKHEEIRISVHMFWNRRIARITVITFCIAIGVLLYYNKDLIQAYNLRTLPAGSLDSRLVPHRIDSIDQLKEIWGKGIRSAEVDLYFKSDGDSGYFSVGHDKDNQSGITLSEYLSSVKSKRIKKLWMDIKNVSPENVEPLLHTLNRLDSAFGIRKIAIVESSSPSGKLRLISEAGYHLSYYLPTDYIEKMLAAGVPDTLRAEAAKLNVQLRDQKVSAVSFDMRLYPFVKQYLEPLIPDSVVYHTWGAVKMWEWGAIKRLEESPTYKDKRVKTILFRVWR